MQKNRVLVKILIHDIHNPLSVIGMYINTLRADLAPPPHVLRNINGAHAALEDIVSNAKTLNHTKDNSTRDTIDIEQCCREGITLFANSLNQKQIDLQLKCSLEPGTAVNINKELFTHSILGNLLSNAIKFSEVGSIIEVALSELGEHVMLEVRDFGNGIPEATLEKLRTNQKVDSKVGTGGEEGRGMGLSIVKSIVESFDGQLMFNSSVYLPALVAL